MKTPDPQARAREIAQQVAHDIAANWIANPDAEYDAAATIASALLAFRNSTIEECAQIALNAEHREGDCACRPIAEGISRLAGAPEDKKKSEKG
jgi:hypothetical protein